jgi:hypothetical protein
MRITATIRTWTGKGWGIANAYPDRRFFVHVSQAVSEEVQLALALNTKITFEEGAPRNAGELPAALQIELAPITVKQIQPVVNTAAPVDPSLAKGEKGGVR